MLNEPLTSEVVRIECGCWFTYLQDASGIKGKHEFHYCDAHRRQLNLDTLEPELRDCIREFQTSPRKRRRTDSH